MFVMTSAMRRAVVVFLWVGSYAATGQADASAENRAAAQALFDEGRSLIQADRPADACPKFEESQRLDPGIGTQLNLAECYERTGRTASAWTLYIDAGAAARQAGQSERAAHAATHATALKDKLSRLVIIVPETMRDEGLIVERGGLSVGKAQWGAAIPVDPGSHTIKVSAPGRVMWETTVTVEPDGITKTVTVPALQPLPDDRSASTPGGQRVGWQRPTAYVVGGIGVAGVIVGAIFGGIAASKKSDAGCNGNVCASVERKRTYEQAQTAGTISTIAFVVGGAALAGGAVLYLTAPKRTVTGGPSIDAQATLAPGMAAVRLGARW
jgi:hypothetical protein